MAQVVARLRGLLSAKNEDVAVAETATTLLELSVADKDELGVMVTVAGQDLDQFIILGRTHTAAAYQTLYSAAGDFTSPAGLVTDASGDLTVLAAAASGWLILNVRPLESIRIQAASGNVAGSTVDAYALAK